MPGAMIGPGGDEVHCTEHHHFPLPPPPTDRTPPRMSYGRYVVPHPETGHAAKFSRATTFAHTLDDTVGLEKWKTRMAVAGLVTSPAVLDAYVRVMDDGGNARRIDAVVEQARVAAGASEAAEFGTAVHAWLEAVDQGRILPADVPERYREHVDRYADMLARHAVEPVPHLTERTVLNSRYGVVGTFDRVYRLPDDTYVMGDVKTSKTLEYGYLGFAMQMALYQGADFMLTLDGTGWEPMPDMLRDYALLAHVPSNAPARSALVTFDLAVGRTGLDTAQLVRDLRGSAASDIPHRHALPVPSDEAARYARAVASIKASTTSGHLAAVWEEYQDVWNDALTTLGHAVIQHHAK